MKKRIVCFLLVVCMATALLPLGALAAPAEGTLDNPWTAGTVKAYLDGSTLYVYGTGAIPSYTAGSQPWYAKAGKIDTIVIETGVTALGDNAFSCCGGLQTLRLKRDMNVSSTGALVTGKNALPVNIEVLLEVSGNGYMADNSSDQPWSNLKNKLTSVIIEEGVKSVGKQAFMNCTKLKSVEIPSTVEIIGQEAFANCTALTDVVLRHDFAQDLQIGSSAFPVSNNGFKINMELTGSAAVPNYADMNLQPWADIRTYIRTLTVGGDVAGIGDNAFNGCTGITGITMYFNESGLKAEKTFGANWLRENSTISVSIRALSENAAFKTWGGGAEAVNKTAESTLLLYNRDKHTVTAEWVAVDQNIVVDPKEDKVFPELEVGYGQIDPYTVTVTNKGNKATGQLLVELSAGNTNAFDLSTKYIDSLAVGESAQFSVAPKTGLDIGSYYSNVAVSNSDGVVASFKVSFIASTNESRTERFVKRLYEKCLNREADPDGVKTWVGQLREGKMTASQVAAEFFSSKEFRLKGLSNEEFVKTLYRTMMDREFDADGLKTWTKQLASGKSRAWVFKQFCDSAEFQNLCTAYTLPWGSIADTSYNMENMNATVSVTAAQGFVTRLYQTALGRSPDADGMKTWTEQLTTHTMTGAQVAANFFASAEYVGKNRSDKDFVEDLYVAMMDRSSDPDGMATWTSQLVLGRSRCWVFKQFCDSAEFHNICSTYGINPGSVTENQYNMGAHSTGTTITTGTGKDSTTTATVVSKEDADAFVKYLYKEILNREADEKGLKNWSDKVVVGAKGVEVAASLMSSAEFQGRKLSNEAFVKVAYRALLGRDADPSGLATWTEHLANGKTRAAVVQSLAGSSECINFCAAKGVVAGNIDAAAWKIG
ncbi:MAG: DUF4214 domain-containing protein [Ruminococcaceae bacterium]|nr:DUF4214 domain-containing protein [Oscillospiraceae bacterium]